MPLTQQEIGDHLALSQQQVSEWLVRLGLSADDGLDAIRLAYIEALRAQASTNAPSAEREQLTRARRRLAELELRRKTGELVNAAEYVAVSRGCARFLRDAALRLPDTLAPVIDPASPPRAHKLLKAWVESMLRSCAAHFEAQGAKVEADELREVA